MSEKIKVIIADDHPLLLMGLKFSLSAEDNIEFCGEATDGKEALDLIIEKNPDIAVLDYDMPKLDGLEVVEQIKSRKINTKIIILSAHKEKDVFKKAIDLGVKGYLLKDCIEDEIMTAIEKVNSDGFYLSPILSGYLIPDNNQETKAEKSMFDELTRMEMKVLKLIASDKITQEIADELFISEKTVSRHRANMCSKFEITGHNALVRFANNHKNEILD